MSTTWLLGQSPFAIIAGTWILYQVLKVLYNLSPLHPLSHIPGPRLAAATYIPEFYHDAILVGRYTHQIVEMHRKYGPIVRINPNEVHCNDVNFSDEIYAVGGRKRDKSIHQINGAVFGRSGFGTIDHDVHRMRRAPLGKFFSRNNIAKLESEIHNLVQKLCDKFLKDSGNVIEIATAFSCFTSDAISGYCFGESFGFLEQDGWYPNFRDPALSTVKPIFFFRFFPWTKSFLILVPWIINYLPTDVALLIKTMQIEMPGRVQKTKAEIESGMSLQYKRPTVFGSLLESDLPEEEKSGARLTDEAGAVVGAGTETTSWSLSVMTYHLLAKPEVLQRLQDELRQVVDDPKNLPPWSVLEALPYLGAVIQEGLRLSYGVSSRTARVATEEDLVYRGEFRGRPLEYVIPRGTAVGMSAAITHHDERVYPNSHEFIPERWLKDKDDPQRKEAERALLAFSKGSRGCPGKTLGLCELTLALSAVVLRVLPHARLYETTIRDVAYDHDTQVPRTVKESKGIRVVIN
ncbi:trichodiene oxygenase [Pyricularia oryzae 70-15]|uniref:Trichodiene oxygenase n=2 Tax=Pyricularia oryzae TaxID=318829 RepID=G4NHI7_PYRO7|nr:trichodiene oxygenase [Pyricularia oryzae 70-15]EHA47697.1 trichodiene oxygenase [Pyricularia oryzae 70-15]ELQ44504.1 trichodiene oxygenase [Pyricularia oryzae Y34]KAI7924761.1 trichodiene oxygenase [Pyricularia oryzae]KAI7931915.1 trichodiene oxygenase [Pyricularia oryzae]